MGRAMVPPRSRRSKAVTEALEDLLGCRALAGADPGAVEDLKQAVARFLTAYADARSEALFASKRSLPVSIPRLAGGENALPGMRIELGDGSRSTVIQTVLGRSGAGSMVVLEDGRTLGKAAVAKARAVAASRR